MSALRKRVRAEQLKAREALQALVANAHRFDLEVVAVAALLLADAGCTCRGEHDEGRAKCALVIAELELEQAVDRVRVPFFASGGAS